MRRKTQHNNNNKLPNLSSKLIDEQINVTKFNENQINEDETWKWEKNDEFKMDERSMRQKLNWWTIGFSKIE